MNLKKVSEDSRVYGLYKLILTKLRIYFYYCFLGRLFRTDLFDYRTLIKNSNLFKGLSVIYRKSGQKITDYFRASILKRSAEDINEDFKYLPLASFSVILCSMILTRIVLSILLHKDMASGELITMGLFLFLGLNGLKNTAQWKDIRDSSGVLRALNIWLRK